MADKLELIELPDFGDIVEYRNGHWAVVIYLDYSKMETLLKLFPTKEDAIEYARKDR